MTFDMTLLLATVLLASVALFALVKRKQSILPWILVQWLLAWAVVGFRQPDLWPVALLGFVQNVAFTFVSRGRNSGSLGYHMIAALFSNSIYAALLFVSIDLVSQAKSNPVNFLFVYTLSTLAGSIFAHWLALRVERGKARTVTENRLETISSVVRKHAARLKDMEERAASGTAPERTLGYVETQLHDGTKVRFWLPDEDADMTALIRKLEQDARQSINLSSADLAKELRKFSGAEIVEVVRGGVGAACIAR